MHAGDVCALSHKCTRDWITGAFACYHGCQLHIASE